MREHNFIGLRGTMRLFFLIFFFCLATGAAWAESPRECVQEIGNAIENADQALFLRKVDLDALIHEGVNVFLAEANKPHNRKNMQPMLAILLQQAASNEGAGNAMRTLLFQETRAFVLNGIRTGAFAGRKVPNAQKEGLLAPLFANASMGRKEIVQIAAGQPTENGTIVPFTILDDGNGLEYPIDGLVQEGPQGLRLTKILNFQDLMRRIQEEATQWEE